MKIQGNIVDVINENIFPGIINIRNNRISGIERTNKRLRNFILPGLVDAHLHIESSMLSPARFAEAAVPHGTTAIVADPHEIANVLGLKGINFLHQGAGSVPLKIFFTAPPCVPATDFETSGAKISYKEIEKLMKLKDVVALGEVMNYTGVIKGDETIIKKLKVAKKYNKPIDGHCPGLSGSNLKKYIKWGISTDHESATLKEAKEKAGLGMKIMLREGSTAKNLKDLSGLVKNSAYQCFLVSDDICPEDLIRGHLDLILRKAVGLGIDPIKAIQMVTLNPIKHYKLEVGLLQKNSPADLIEVNNLRDFKVLRVFINGKIAAQNGRALFKIKPLKVVESAFRIKKKTAADFVIPAAKNVKLHGIEPVVSFGSGFRGAKPRTVPPPNSGGGTGAWVRVRIIGMIENQIITKEIIKELEIENGDIKTDVKNDILKLAVCERYGKNNIGLGFINGFGLKRGAIASSISHDSHNIITVGTNNYDMARAVNLAAGKGGLTAVCGRKICLLELPLAGLMTDEPADRCSKKLEKINRFVKKMGGRPKNPFMTLSFMALLVIPKLKLSDRGLFDVEKFKFTNLIYTGKICSGS